MTPVRKYTEEEKKVTQLMMKLPTGNVIFMAALKEKEKRQADRGYKEPELSVAKYWKQCSENTTPVYVPDTEMIEILTEWGILDIIKNKI